MAARKTRSTKHKVSTLKPKRLSSGQTKRVKGGVRNIAGNVKTG